MCYPTNYLDIVRLSCLLSRGKVRDLEAIHKKTILRIEVKGLSGENVFVEITPNEYKKMNDYQESYRLCVVTECIVNLIIHVFSQSSEKNTWLNKDGNELIIDQIISAKCYV